MSDYRRRHKRAFIEGGIVLAILAAVLGGSLVWANADFARKLESLGDPFADLENRPSGSTTAPGQRAPVNILLVGSDGPVDAGDPTEWDEVSGHTDAVMLLHLPADRERLYVMSVPRDSWVRLPQHGEGRISSAFERGGPSLLVAATEELTGVRIDHLAVTDFDSFARLTDHLGGVRITIPETTYNSARGATIPAGTYEMDGAEAVLYARQRHGLPGEDLDRVRRQQNWMRSLGERAIDRGVLDNPVALNGVLQVMTESLAVDDGFTVARMRELALSARPVDEVKDMVFFTAPISRTSTSEDDQTITWLDRSAVTEVSTAMTEDRLAEYLAENDDIEVLGERVR